MSFLIKLVKVIKPGSGEWSQATEVIPEVATETRLFVFITIKNKIVIDDVVLDLNELSVKMTKEISEVFFQNKNPESADLKNSINLVYSKNKTPGLIIEIAAASILDDSIFVSAIGGGGVSLFRQSSLVKLLASGHSVVYASGKIAEKDRFVLVGSKLYENIGEQKLKRLLLEDNEEKIIRHLTSHIGLHQNKEASFAILKIGRKDLGFTVSVGEANLARSIRHPMFENPAGLISLLKKLKKDPRQQEDYAKDNRRGKIYAILGIILILLLTFLISYGVIKKKAQDERDSYAANLSLAQEKLTEAIAKFPNDKNLARESFLESEKIAATFSDKKQSDSLVDDLFNKLQKNKGKILGIYEVEPELYLDLDLVVDGFSGSAMALSEEQSYVLDKVNKSVIKIDLMDKRSEVVKGIDKGGVINAIAPFVDNLYVFTGEVSSIVDGQTKKIDEGFDADRTLMGSYGGNLYLLEKDKNTIWRFSAVDGGLAPKKEWLSENNKVELGNALDMAIDGSIWVFSSPSKVIVLTSGNQRPFNLSGDVGALTGIYTDEKTNEVYFLDKSAGKILTYKKTGEFVAEYVSEKIKQAEDFVVFSAQRKIYLLTVHEIFYIDMTH